VQRDLRYINWILLLEGLSEAGLKSEAFFGLAFDCDAVLLKGLLFVKKRGGKTNDDI
jgi:hypothetical protein